MGERVAVIKNSYTPYGGAEKYTARVVDAFARRGYGVDVLTSARGTWGSGPVARVPIRSISFNNALKVWTFNAGCRRYLERSLEGYRSVLGMDRTDAATHIRAGGGSHRAWLARRAGHLSWPRRVSLALNPFHRLMLEIERRSVAGPHLKKLICNSRMVEREFAEIYGVPGEKLAVVHNGVEWGAFAEPFEAALAGGEGAKRDVGLAAGAFHFLFVGSGYGRKGLGYALAALARLPADCRLVVVGRDRDEGRYRRLAERAGVAGRVVFAGPRRDVVRYLQACDAFVLPTIYDPFSNATIEALAMGLYVVTTGANGCAEIVVDGAGTIVQDPADPGELEAAMRRALGGRDRRFIRDSVRAFEFEAKLDELIRICTES